MEYNLKNLTDKVLGGGQIERDEAVFLYDQPLGELTRSADEIRKYFCRNRFDLCSIINAKSGRCSENCKFCAQSASPSSPAGTGPELGAICRSQISAAAVKGGNYHPIL